MILGFSGYLIFGKDYLCIQYRRAQFLCHLSGLIIGLAYEKITKIIPLFVVLCIILCMTERDVGTDGPQVLV